MAIGPFNIGGGGSGGDGASQIATALGLYTDDDGDLAQMEEAEEESNG